MDKRYEPSNVEEKIYALWEKSGFFNPDNLPNAQSLKPKAFSVIMPPPNANGSLHIGHALFVTLQDIMIRFNRMKGLKTLWLPGADHAGFETQVVFDKKLEKEGRSRFKMDREDLYKEMLEFTEDNRKIMENQLRKLGASCDWSRKQFTLDKHIVEETQNTFIKMYKDGLIYRGLRTVNWCVKHQTALSGLEVKRKDEKGKLYYLKYGPFELATARPETKFGDTAVAVHPSDKRYKKYIGKEIEIEGLAGNFTVKVIADKAVDPEFGTGVIKVTPAHDPLDFEISQRHDLEIKQVIDRYGKLNELAGPYAGMKVQDAREKIAEDLKEKGLLIKVDENYTHSLATCYKCERVLEPIPLPQWFIKTKDLAKPAIEAVEKGRITFTPARFKKIYLHWLKNIEDWNISRQIIWGIRIPAWMCEKSQILNTKSQTNSKTNPYTLNAKPSRCEPIISIKKPTSCPKCKSKKLTQDPDVFDTWFSSGQWPYLTLGFKDSGKHGKDFKEFYPTSVMETGWDILFFWVARMVMLGLYRTKKVPFKHVYLNGLVRDKDRQKMSKSKGNVIDPLGVAEEYGTDAVRMALIVGATPGNDPIISEDKIRGYRNFATKLWNITRFVSMNYEKPKSTWKPNAKEKKLIKQLEETKKKVTTYIENDKFHNAAEEVYHYIWHTFADKIIEDSKNDLPSASRRTIPLLTYILEECVTMLHPFMPYITEEIYGHLQELQGIPKNKRELLLVKKW